MTIATSSTKHLQALLLATSVLGYTACKQSDGRSKVYDTKAVIQNFSLTLAPQAWTLRPTASDVKITKFGSFKQTADLSGPVALTAAGKFLPLTPVGDSKSKPQFTITLDITSGQIEHFCLNKNATNLAENVSLSCATKNDLLTELKDLCKKIANQPGSTQPFIDTNNGKCNCPKAANGSVNYEDFLGKPTAFEAACLGTPINASEIPDAPTSQSATTHLEEICTSLANSECGGSSNCGVKGGACKCPDKENLVAFADYLNQPLAFIKNCSRSPDSAGQAMQTKLESLKAACNQKTAGIGKLIDPPSGPICRCSIGGTSQDHHLNEWLNRSEGAFIAACMGD